MKMVKLPRLLLAGLLLVLLLPGCQTRPPARDNRAGEPQAAAAEYRRLIEFMDTSPQDGSLVFLGVAGIRFRRQESINLALQDAARRLAIFRNVEGEFYTQVTRGGRLLDYRAETTTALRYSTAHIMGYIDAFEFDEQYDVLESENALFVRVRYAGSLGLNYRPSFPRPGGRPSWIESPPESIGGYLVGVGYAGRRHAHRDTVTASFDNAIFNIILTLSAVAWEERFAYRGQGFLDFAFTVQESISAHAALNAFYVLETWTDPADRSVWTLAVARGTAL